jgi:hypothetical protein
MILYVVYQMIVALPLLWVAKESSPISAAFQNTFVVSSICAFVLFNSVAITNPGFIQGSQRDVGRRAGAYNPKDY